MDLIGNNKIKSYLELIVNANRSLRVFQILILPAILNIILKI